MMRREGFGALLDLASSRLWQDADYEAQSVREILQPRFDSPWNRRR